MAPAKNIKKKSETVKTEHKNKKNKKQTKEEQK